VALKGIQPLMLLYIKAICTSLLPDARLVIVRYQYDYLKVKDSPYFYIIQSAQALC